MNQAAVQSPPVRKSLEEYGRGLAGGLLFSLPLLYTMEVWWTAFIASPERLLVAVAVVFALLLGFNRFSGLHPGTSAMEVVIDSVEELGIGFLLAAVVLFLTGQLSFQESAPEALGRLTLEGMAAAIGVSIGTAQLGENGENDQKEEDEEHPGLGGEIMLALLGAVVVGANVAPTEEILTMAIQSSPEQLLAVLLLCFVLASTVLHFSEFKSNRPFIHDGLIPPVLFGTTTTVAVALATSAGLLWFFNRFSNMAPIVCVAQTMVLGLPATLGASAGRLLLRA